MAIGKTAPNGTLNADGAFYSVQDVNVLLENAGGGGGGELPTPTVADAGSVVVVDDEGKYALGEAGGGGVLFVDTTTGTLDKTFLEIKTAFLNGTIIYGTYTQTGDSGDSILYSPIEGLIIAEAGGMVTIAATDFSADTDNDYPVVLY